jgi:phosphatidylglycerophosphatase C
VRTSSAIQVLARIDEERRREPGGALAFDGDGTLWAGDVGEDFFAALLEDGGLSPRAHDALVAEASDAGIDTAGTAVEVAHRIHAAYLAGTFDEERVCEIMTWACAGRRREDVDAFADRVLDAVSFSARLHGEALRIVGWAREAGVALHLVSASPRPIVDAAARRLRFEVANVSSATEVVDAAGVVVPEVHRPIPYGDGKVVRLRERLGARPLYAAFGDNAFDVPMLRESRVPVLIRPKARLLERAAELPGAVVLEQL